MAETTIYRPHALDDLADPWLLRSLRSWRRMADARGRVSLGGDLDPIMRNRELLLPASTLLIVEGDDPMDFVVGWQGSHSRIGLGKNLLGCRLGDYSDAAYAAAAAAPLRLAADGAEIAYHEVFAHIGGRAFHYDRILLPIVWRGSVDMLLCVSRWRSPALALSGASMTPDARGYAETRCAARSSTCSDAATIRFASSSISARVL